MGQSIRNAFGELRGTWTRWRNTRRTRDNRLRCTPAALVIEPPRSEAATILWRTITHVAAFKRDCYVVDSIRMLLATSDGCFYEVAEEDDGFDELIAQLPERLEGCASMGEWYFQVAFPAFETNLTPLYPSAGG